MEACMLINNSLDNGKTCHGQALPRGFEFRQDVTAPLQAIWSTYTGWLAAVFHSHVAFLLI